MELIEVSNDEYAKIVQNPFTRFQAASFYAINAHKVDDVFYLIFRDGKDRFALAVGIEGCEIRLPFSASFECFSELAQPNKIRYYNDAIEALVDWAKCKGIKKISWALPPDYYDISHISKLSNALFCNGFSLAVQDVNFEYYLSDFDDNYLNRIAYNAKKSLNKSFAAGLSFEKTDDTISVYEVIKQNREEKGYPLRMSYQNVVDTAQIIPSDFFIVKNKALFPIASALVHHINDDILRVVYWGNLQESNSLCPMNFISYNIFKYYSATQFKIVDIGPSTENSIPNFGLCDFKESIGCKCSLKNTFVKLL